MANFPQPHWENLNPNNPIPFPAIHEQELPPPYPAPKKQRSLDIPQRIEKRLARLNASESMVSRWSVELISWTISAVCMAAIIGIAAWLENEQPPSWLSTLNTILAKVAAATLIIPTSEAIGQLKWNWFNGGVSKEMLDFEIFDKASRGPWGAFMLLLRTKGKSLAALGAVLTLLMLAIDTFFQQLIDVPERWIVQGTSEIPRVVNWDPRRPVIYKAGAKQGSTDSEMDAVVNKFFWSNATSQVFGNSTRSNHPVYCPTSKCTWPLYQTLGVCSSCVDISDLLTNACLTAKIDWTSNLTTVDKNYASGSMCGYFINATSETPILMSGYNVETNASSLGEGLLMRAWPLTTVPDRKPLYYNGSINFKHIRNPLADFIISSAGNDNATVFRNKKRPAAYECSLYWCVKTIKSTYDRAAYKETIVDTFTNSTPGPWPWVAVRSINSAHNGTDTMFLEQIIIDTPGEAKTERYGTENTTHMHTIFSLNRFLPSFTTIRRGAYQPVMRVDTGDAKVATDLIAAYNPWLSPDTIPQHVSRLAIAMTDLVRSAANAEHVVGQAWETEAFVSVKWGWIAFPLALLVLSLFFLLATILRTSSEKSDVGVWKTSAMPTLIYSLPKDLQRSLTSDGPAWTMAGRAGVQKTRIKLSPNQGWRVSGYSSAPSTPTMRRNQAPPGWI